MTVIKFSRKTMSVGLLCRKESCPQKTQKPLRTVMLSGWESHHIGSESQYSFIFTSVFPLRRVAAVLRGLKKLSFQQRLIVMLHHTKMRPSKVGDVITPPGLWSTPGPLSSGCRQHGFPRRYFLVHSDHMAGPTLLGSLLV